MRVQGPRSNEIEQSYWMRAINLTLWPLDKGPRPKSGKSRLNLHGTISEGKSIDLQTPKKKNSAKKESS
jgi:hypothetical protein